MREREGAKKGSMENASNKRDSTKLAVRLTAGMVVILLVVFFAFTLNNMITISREVESIKNGPYPASVAAGHIETNLARLETYAQGLISLDKFADNNQAISDKLQSIDDDIQNQLSIISPYDLKDPEVVTTLKVSYGVLSGRLGAFCDLCENPNTSATELESYFTTYISPMIKSLMINVNVIMDETTAVVDDMYQVVNSAANQTIFLSSILMVSVIFMVGVYFFLIRRKDQQEQILRDDLEKAVIEAQNANIAKSEFLSNMSHDIRTPMNAIVGLTTIANDNLDDPLRMKQCLTRITTSSRHLLSLINDVLDMNKIESGKAILSEERFNLPDITSELINIVEPQAREKKLKTDFLVYNVDHEELIGDAMRLRQILLNLVSNAVKYTNEGDIVRVIITEDDCDEERKTLLQITVEDSGIGMDEEFLKRVFDPFEREQNETTNFTEGTGLGMAITKNLVDLMGGTISVRSEVGVGTEFTVRLPMFVAAYGAHLDSAAHAVTNGEDICVEGERDNVLELSPEPMYDIDGFDALRVLIADDNYVVAQNALTVMRDFGIEARIVQSGSEAIRIAVDAEQQGQPFDLMIVDMTMPDLNGIETVARINEQLGENAPHTVLSAYVWSNLEDQARAAGIHSFIHKPMFKSRLYAVIRRECFEDEATAEVSEIRKKEPVSGRVLLVDDNDINLEIGAELISQLGPEVETATDGLEAIAKVSDAQEGYFDLVFMDCKMPHMNGFETTEAIIKLCNDRGHKQIPIIAMTANAFKEDRDHAYASGMSGFMSKPVNIHELEDNLRRFLS